jgi:hypothetical protein
LGVDIKIDIVKNRKTFFIRVVALITLGIGCFAYFASINLGFLIIGLIQFISLFIPSNYLYQKIGSLEFKENEIVISTNSDKVIPLIDIISLRLFYNDQKVNVTSKRWFGIGFIIKMLIETKEDSLQEYKLLVKISERDNYIKALEKLYSKQINIRERNELGAKYFLLKGNLSYKEIQEIKSKYNISW